MIPQLQAIPQTTSRVTKMTSGIRALGPLVVTPWSVCRFRAVSVRAGAPSVASGFRAFRCHPWTAGPPATVGKVS